MAINREFFPHFTKMRTSSYSSTAMQLIICIVLLVTLSLAVLSALGQATQPSRLEYYDSRGYKLQVESTTIAGTASGGTASTGGGGTSNATGDGDLYNTGRLRLPHHIAHNSKKNLVYTNDVPFVGGALKVLDLTKQTIRTVCGQQPTRTNKDGACGLDGKSGVGAVKFSYAYMIYDATRDYLYAMDSVDTSIHRIDMSQYDGANSPPIITTVTQLWTNTTACPPELKAGTAFSSMPYNSSALRFCKPSSMTLDETKNILYIADSLFGGILQIDFTNKIVSSLLVGAIGSIQPATIAKVFYRPASNSLMIGTSDATVGPIRTASCNLQIATYSLTNKALIADYPAPKIPQCTYYYIQGVDDNSLILFQQQGTQLQQTDLTTNVSKIIGGTYFFQDYGAPQSTIDGPANTTWLNRQSVSGMFLDTKNGISNLYIADWSFHRVSRINLNTAQSEWLGGGGRTAQDIKSGPAGVGGIGKPWNLEYWPNNNTLLFIDSYSTRARQVTPAGAIIDVNGGSYTYDHTNHLDACGPSLFGNLTKNPYLYMGFLTRTMRVDPLHPANLFIPALTCMSYLDSSMNWVYNVSMERVPNLIMNGFGSIPDMQISIDGNNMFWIQQWHDANAVYTNTIVRSRPTTSANRLSWKDTIICGNGGLYSRSDGQCGQGGYSGVATMQHPSALVIDEKSKRLYLADGHQIRYLYPYDSDTPTLTTLLGKGLTYSSDGPASIAGFNSLQFMAFGTFHSVPFIWATDVGFMNVRMIDLTNVSNPMAYTIAGPTGMVGDAIVSNTQWIDGIGAAIRFNAPVGIAYDGVDTLWIADRDNNKIRQLTLSYPQAAPSSSTAALSSSSTAKSSSSSSTAKSSSSTSLMSSTATSSSSTSTSTAASSSTQQSTAASSTAPSSSTASSTSDSASTSSDSSSSSTSSSSDSVVGSSSSTGTGGDTGIGGASQLEQPSLTSALLLLLVTIIFVV